MSRLRVVTLTSDDIHDVFNVNVQGFILHVSDEYLGVDVIYFKHECKWSKHIVLFGRYKVIESELQAPDDSSCSILMIPQDGAIIPTTLLREVVGFEYCLFLGDEWGDKNYSYLFDTIIDYDNSIYTDIHRLIKMSMDLLDNKDSSHNIRAQFDKYRGML